MGQTGSFTAKVNLRPTLLPYTKWGAPQLQAVMLRSRHELADTFALRSQEFIFLLGRRDVDIAGAIDVFNNVFDTDSNKLVDKLEVLCILCLASKLSSELKVEMLYDIFDFDNKGYLSQVELLLLFKIVTAASHKADKAILPPSNEVMAHIINSAWGYSERGTETLRKYELVAFAANSPEIRNYMEVWRGHASQVFVVNNQKWQDTTFPATHTSIAPSKEWLSIGLPPASFVTWLRRPRLKPSCETLFGHSDRYAKAVNKMVLDGFGALANGTLVEGLIASAWIINALATILGSSKVVMSLFSTTAQEFLGRFCVRLFDGGRWNSVFIDDRIPCTADGFPIFTRSSFSQECWVLLLEKAIAKHLGSYGHIAVSAKRADAIEAILRMLTGGHVTKLHAGDYDWKSVADEVKGEDGMALVTKILTEGSLISFGRSEPLLLNRTTLARFPTTSLPHGRLFSVVGIEDQSNHRYLVLRDAWGLQQVRSEETGEADHGSGHCRTFLVRAEDVLQKFDTIFIVRFPDCLRGLDASPFRQWTTRIRSNLDSGREAPAIFKLCVQRIGAVDNEEIDHPDVITQETSGAAVVEPPSAEDGYFSGNEERAEGLEAGEVAALAKKKKVLPKPVECCITMNSSVEWMKSVPSEREEDLPRIFIRIYPTEVTLADLKDKNRDMLSINKNRGSNDYNFQNRKDKAQYGSAVPEQVVPGMEASPAQSAMDTSENSGIERADVDHSQTRDPNATFPASLLGSDLKETAEKQADELLPNDAFQIMTSSRRNWKSMSLYLWPGEYYIVSSVEYSPGVNLTHSIEAKLKDAFVKSQAKTLWELPSEKMHRIWAQVSSHENVDVLPVGPETSSSASDIANIIRDFTESINQKRQPFLEREMWPFLIEHQLDCGPIGLVEILYRLRRETNVAMSELYALRVRLESEVLEQSAAKL